MDYQSLQDILADEELALGDTKPTVDDVRRAIDTRLRALQTDTIARTPDIYRRLVSARESLDRLGKETPEHKSTELVPISLLERVLDVIQKPTPSSGPQEPPVIERIQKTRSVAITKASEDFRNRRTIPTAGIGAIAAAVWATRQIFGVNLTHVGTTIWAVGAGGTVIIAAILLLLMHKAQRNDEQALRRLFDPDVQGYALRDTRSGITRAQYRRALWYLSVVPSKRITARFGLIRKWRRRRAAKLERLRFEAIDREEVYRTEESIEERRAIQEKLYSYYPPVPGKRILSELSSDTSFPSRRCF